jgi:hypothetical protein
MSWWWRDKASGFEIIDIYRRVLCVCAGMGLEASKHATLMRLLFCCMNE